MAEADVNLPIHQPAKAKMARSLGGVIAQQSSPLASIPIEILLQINKHLTTPEYGNLRLTCKHIEDQLLNAFSREFFQKRQFMFTEFSLQALVGISKSRFAATLIHVILGLEQPQPGNPAFPFRPTTAEHSMIVRYNKVTTEWFNHATFLSTGRNVDLLAQAFSSLSQLETVGLRDFNSRSRYRDKPNISWKSYGVSTYFRETGSLMQNPSGRRTHDDTLIGGHVIPLHRAFVDILRAAGKANIHLKHFEIILRTLALGDRAFNFPDYLKPVIGPVITNLRTILLELRSDSDAMYVATNGQVTLCHCYFLMKFLSRTIQLEHLRLNFRTHDEMSLLSWLSRPPPVPSIPVALLAGHEEPHPVLLENLRRIDIGMVAVDPNLVLAIIRKFRATLHVISLHKVTFIHEDEVPADERVNLWARLFEEMSKLDLKLEGINMSLNAQEQPGRQHRRRVIFKDCPTSKDNAKYWAGNDTQSGLRDFQALVAIDGLDHDTDLESNGSSDEEHSDNSMDDLDHEDDADEADGDETEPE